MVSKLAALRAAVPAELRGWVDNRLISAHIRIVRAMALILLLNAAMIGFAMWGELPSLRIALFTSSMLGAVLHRLWLAEGIERGRRRRNPVKMKRAFWLNSMWLGINFAGPFGLWFGELSHGVQLLLAVCAVSQIAAAAYMMRTMVQSALIFIAAQTLWLTAGLAQLGSVPALAAIAVLLVASGLLIRMTITARDMFVTRILSDRELAAASRTVKLLLNEYEESGSDWLFELDANHRLVRVSPRFARAAGEPARELDGQRFVALFAPDAQREVLEEALEARRPLRDMVLALDGAGVGEPHWWSISGRPSYSGDEIAYRGVISDVTGQRQAEHRAHRMAHFDTLTGLPNRALFDQALDEAFAKREAGEQVALLLLDVDHFKSINDMHGHPVGDGVLRELAGRLASCVGESGLGGCSPVVARLGGDEFAVLVSGDDACDHAVRLAELLVVTMTEPVQVDQLELSGGISIGLALAPYHTEERHQLQSYADIALNAVKISGRGKWEMFEPGMDAALHERHALARDLRHAVAHGELRLFLQPLIDVESEVPTGYEALLRWQHPSRGLVSPDSFIPIAEETGQIVAIGEWVIRTALAEAARWTGGETVAINLSPIQVETLGLVPVVINALADSGIDPARVEFEITEGVLLGNSEANIEVLRQLQALGVKIALDDFGTGYASLNYLLTFPFDKIKIDRRFISDLVTREESRAIVGAVISLANQLGMCTLAEGVEEREQFTHLRADGCRMVQGWLFGKALPSEAYHPRQSTPPAAAPVRLPRARKSRATQTYSRRARG